MEKTNDREFKAARGQNKDLTHWRYEMIESLMKLHTCADCPIRRKAARKPGSLLARIHRWHATWWPGWKIYQAELGIRGAKPTPRAQSSCPQN